MDLGYNIRDPRVLKEMYEVGCYIDPYDDEGDLDGVVSIKSLADLISKENAKSILEGGNGEKGIPDDEEDIYEYMEKLN